MFPIRLRALRKGQNISMNQLAQNLNAKFPEDEHKNTSSQIGNWERGIRSPSYVEIKKLALYFNVSMDYLSGRTSMEHLNLGTVLMDKNELTFGDHTLDQRDRYEIYQLINGYLQGKDNRHKETEDDEPSSHQEKLNLNFDDYKM
ncbi:helix-turn-helix domain-containing protein [Apilactobacillus bombintestini]|uniref:XRE family transcriptional regulator n=1 Tax=Apilactobacillus bombintestini TaxID=2419772 RepID=A0A387AUL3_9LACO|nr:helix-turn-helix transcriptional regulator [Apilactobacillus bombintestini]AYF93031.1 XRE family transcriptional regulator [Apilactobacillus bombintestini]